MLRICAADEVVPDDEVNERIMRVQEAWIEHDVCCQLLYDEYLLIVSELNCNDWWHMICAVKHLVYCPVSRVLCLERHFELCFLHGNHWQITCEVQELMAVL